MKTLICVLSLMATIAWTQELDFTIQRPSKLEGEHPAHGFSGFVFGSSRNYITQERAKDGWSEGVYEADWLWYSGNVGGCAVDYGYLFKPNANSVELMVGGIWEVANTDECYQIVEADLADYYGSHVTTEVWENGRIEATREINWTTIRHRKSEGDHSVWFFDTRD